MSSFLRRQTNLEEVETTPFGHKYLLQRPRLMQKLTPTSSIDLPLVSPESRQAQQNGTALDRSISATERHESDIDNPVAEKRASSSPMP